MLIDEAEITIKGGHGGKGLISFGKKAKSGPDGGNGGRGGDIYLIGSTDITLLNQFSEQKEYEGNPGKDGGTNKKTGKSGEDIYITVPIGTVLTDKTTGEVFEIKTVEDKILIAKGGLGGRGNYEFRNPRRTTPMYAQPGLPGEFRELSVELKLIAHYGLIGLPNAGKSSLLNELTNANAKIGQYAFTTLSPNLGMAKGRILADIPGLIEGAHEGKGLGIKFLKHIEKVKTLLHCISAETQNLKKDYEVVKKELGEYKSNLLKKDEVIILTKSDLVSKEKLTSLLNKAKKLNKNVLAVSIHDYESIEKLKDSII